MFRPGLVSVTFRSLSPEAIVELCAANPLQGIEWGGDVHVPPGEIKTADRVRSLTVDAGLQVACYGSYYRCGGPDPAAFVPVLESALALQAPTIRVWAGSSGSAESDALNFDRVASDLARITQIAVQAGVTIATEYHGGTLTDTRASCAALLAGVNHPDLKTLWQPLRRAEGDTLTSENLQDLLDVLPFLEHVHVYDWVQREGKRLAVSLQGSSQWPSYLRTLATHKPNCWLLLEFLPEESPENLRLEAAALAALIAETQNGNIVA